MTAPTPTPDQQTWRVIAHASALIQFIGVPSFVGPLVVWLMRREDPVVVPHARAALNFQLSLIIYFVAGIILGVILVLTVLGIALAVFIFLFLGVLVVAEVVFAILASLAASRGEIYVYPLSIELIKA